MPRSMALPISVGTDICHAKRIYDRFMIQKPQTVVKFAKRIFTPEEFFAHETRINGPVQRWMKYYGTALAQPPAWSTNWIQSTRLPRSEHLGGSGAEIVYTAAQGWIGNVSPTEEEKGTVQARLNMQKLALFLAGRFAAKEAIVKAHPSRHLTYWDIQITSPPSKDGMSQPPVAIVKSEHSGNWEDGQEVPISISHDGEYATATSIIVDPSLFKSIGSSSPPNTQADSSEAAP